MTLRRFALLAAWVVGIVVFAVTARHFPVLAVLVAVVGGLAGIMYLITVRRGPSRLNPEHERSTALRHDLPSGPPSM